MAAPLFLPLPTRSSNPPPVAVELPPLLPTPAGDGCNAGELTAQIPWTPTTITGPKSQQLSKAVVFFPTSGDIPSATITPSAATGTEIRQTSHRRLPLYPSQTDSSLTGGSTSMNATNKEPLRRHPPPPFHPVISSFTKTTHFRRHISNPPVAWKTVGLAFIRKKKRRPREFFTVHSGVTTSSPASPSALLRSGTTPLTGGLGKKMIQRAWEKAWEMSGFIGRRREEEEKKKGRRGLTKVI